MTAQRSQRAILCVLLFGVFAILGWVMIAATLDDLPGHPSPPFIRRHPLWRRSPVPSAPSARPIILDEDDGIEFNLRRCECIKHYKEPKDHLGICKCRGNCPAFVTPAFLTEAAGQNLCSPYEKSGYKCYAECEHERSEIVKWFAAPCGEPGKEECDPILKRSKSQLEAIQRASDPLGGFLRITAAAENGLPEQIWINYGMTADSMVIGWHTNSTITPAGSSSTVLFGTSPGVYTHSASGDSSAYTYGSKYSSGQIHHVTLTGLSPHTLYYYHVGKQGSPGEWSFISNPGSARNSPYPFVLALIGDVGLSRDAQLTVYRLSHGGNMNATVILGDITYARGCESNGCTDWDAFQRMFALVSANTPTSVVMGNHDMDDNFNGIPAISSQHRFSGMPFPKGSSDGVLYFSYNAGPIHIVTLSSFYPGGFSKASAQTVWLAADLAAVDRSQYPWVIVALHAPWYTSETRYAIEGQEAREAYEALLIEYGVNAIFSGHVHTYERTHPVDHQRIVPAGSGIVHVTVGTSGAALYSPPSSRPDWSAFRASFHGHAKLVVANNTHARIEWHVHGHIDQLETTIADSYWLVNLHYGSG